MDIASLTPPIEPVVVVRGLTKAYDGRTVVDHLDLAVHDEVLGLIGANGAGKTTTAARPKGASSISRTDQGGAMLALSK